MSKYHVSPPGQRTVDNIVFASKAEMKRYFELKLMVKAGEIQELQLQPRFELQPAFERNGKHFQAITYVADFAYFDNKTKKRVIEEVKGVETEAYKIKRKMFHFKHNMELRVIKVQGQAGT